MNVMYSLARALGTMCEDKSDSLMSAKAMPIGLIGYSANFSYCYANSKGLVYFESELFYCMYFNIYLIHCSLFCILPFQLSVLASDHICSLRNQVGQDFFVDPCGVVYLHLKLVRNTRVHQKFLL